MSEHELGQKAGKIDAHLAQHEARLDKINGSIDRSTAVLADLANCIRDGLRDLASEIRTLQEEGRLAEERVNVAAATLASDAGRRRAELEATASGLAATASALAATDAKSDRAWTKKQQLAGLLIAAAGIVITVYFATPN